MQREGSACWTTPSSVIRIANAGQTWAQGATGSSQCMQTVGCVATLAPRSTKSTITMLSPLCESHSRQAASHARQPMQRAGSMNNVLIAMVLPEIESSRTMRHGGDGEWGLPVQDLLLPAVEHTGRAGEADQGADHEDHPPQLVFPEIAEGFHHVLLLLSMSGPSRRHSAGTRHLARPIPRRAEEGQQEAVQSPPAGHAPAENDDRADQDHRRVRAGGT